MLGPAFAAGIRPGWVSMDEAYGQSKSLRVWLEKDDQQYVVATRRNDDIITTTSMGTARADELIAALPGRAWSRISAGSGAHGPREYDTGPDLLATRARALASSPAATAPPVNWPTTSVTALGRRG